MLLKLRWSPFLKSFKKRSILTSAICGKQGHTARMILKEYEYTAIVPAVAPWLKGHDKFKVFGKDEDDNNILHHCYLNEMPDIRQMIRDSSFIHMG